MITRSSLVAYSELLAQISELAQRDIATVLYQLRGASAETIEEAIIELYPSIADRYSAASAVVAAEFYDSIRQAQLGRGILTILADPQTVDSYLTSAYWSLDGDDITDRLMTSMDRHVRRGSQDTMLANIFNDYERPRWAWVPMNATPCAWCTLIASRGFDFSKAGIESMYEKRHDNCKCEIVPSWETSPRVEGFDRERFLKIYEDSYDEESGDVSLKRRRGESSSDYRRRIETNRLMSRMRKAIKAQ